MKELSTEEKAKRYDEAIERARDSYNYPSYPGFIRADVVFPELKESEDEKIRKSLIILLQHFCKGYRVPGLEFPVSYKDMLAWLEKQGEHKLPIEKLPEEMKTIGESLEFTTQEECDEYNQMVSDLIMSDDKNKPKFHEGEWVVFNDKHESVYQIEKIENFQYTLRHILGGSMPLSFSGEDMIRPWAIQDARDGDVLACNEEILLFKSYSVQGRISLYCWYNGQTNNFHSKEVVDTLMTTRNKIYPATKEQRDILFSKMKEAGYEWDENNKILKEIVEDEEEPQNYKNQVMSEITDLVKHYIRQKPVWSEEDDGMFDTMEGWLDTLCEYLNDSSSECIPNVESCINWFKSLKERFLPQPKQDWTEEDEHRAEDTIYFLDTAKKHYASTVELDACIDWLKAIKDRYSWKPSSELDETSYQVGIKRVLENPESYGLTKYNWKPSDEQMNALSVAVKHGQTDDPDALKKLLEQLKKLKGE